MVVVVVMKEEEEEEEQPQPQQQQQQQEEEAAEALPIFERGHNSAIGTARRFNCVSVENVQILAS